MRFLREIRYAIADSGNLILMAGLLLLGLNLVASYLAG
jgi:hypothetical protein